MGIKAGTKLGLYLFLALNYKGFLVALGCQVLDPTGAFIQGQSSIGGPSLIVHFVRLYYVIGSPQSKIRGTSSFVFPCLFSLSSWRLIINIKNL